MIPNPLFFTCLSLLPRSPSFSTSSPDRTWRGVMTTIPSRRRRRRLNLSQRVEFAVNLAALLVPDELKLWLFVAYVVSFVSLAGSVGLLIQDTLTDKGPSAWTGVAGVLQCVFVLISGLIYWTSHSEE